MPIQIPTELLTASSGSVGDLVFSRNQHGPYTRARTSPTDPASALQLAVRAALTGLVNAWKNTLTQTERKSWDAFALAVRTRTALGRSTNAGGLGMYIRANVPRIQAAAPALPRVDQAPTLFTSAPFTPITRLVLNIVNDTLYVFFDASDAWVTETGAAMLFYASPPQLLARNFWAGPYRYAGPILGNPFPRPGSPATIPLPFPAGLDQRVFVRFRLTRADARLSASARLPADHLPQVPPVPTAVASQFIFPTLLVDITFDHLLQGTLLATAPWSVRQAGRDWNIGTARVDDNRLRLFCTRGIVDPGPDQVTYAPPPADVIALLTAIPAAAFVRPIPWN